MDTRGQFTFYKSYWDAIEELPTKSRLPILQAIIRYALFGEEPANLPSTCRAVFLLVKPTLDASRKKAANGKLGGKTPKANGKQTESKPQAPTKQTEREKEKEGEKENEVEIEGEEEKEKEHPALLVAGTCFTAFFDAYPNKRKRDDAWRAWKSLNPDQTTVDKIMAALSAWKKSTQWADDGGRFIPLAANFLSDDGYWLSPPTQAPTAVPRQLDEDEQRAIRQMLTEDDCL